MKKALLLLISFFPIAAHAQTKTFVSSYTPATWSSSTSYALNDFATTGTGSSLCTYISLVPSNLNNSPQTTLGVDWNIIGCASSSGGGSGTVTSVGLSLPSIFSLAGSPVTSSGTFVATFLTQNANTFFRGPASGAAAAPAFGPLVLGDLPTGIPNANLLNSSTTVNGVSCVLGGSCTISGSGGSGTVNSGTAFSPAYYPSAGGAQVSGVTPFTGLAYFTPSAPPVAASSANVQTAIGAGVYDSAGAAANVIAGVQTGQYISGTDSGTANAYAVTLSPAPSSLPSGTAVRLKVANTSTGASTLSINGTSVPIRKKTSAGLAAIGAGDLVAGQIYTFDLDGTYAQTSAIGTSSGLSLTPSAAQYVIQPPTVAGSAETFTGLTQTTGVIGNPWATYAGADMRSPMYQISTAGIYTGGYHAYGDSITAGQLATVPANRWVNILATATGATLTQYAVGGNFAEDDVNAIFNNENPGASAATLYTYADGINNKSRGLGAVVEQQYTDAYTAGAMRLSTPSTLVSLPATTPTNWTVGTQYAANPGICSTTNNATFTQSLTTTAFGQAIFIWYAKNDASGGSFRWQTDDGQSGTASSNYLPNLINTPNGSTTSVATIIESNIARVAASSHSVQITVTSATNAANPVCILGVGVSPPSGSFTATSPAVWLEGVKREAGPNNGEQEAQLTGRYNWLSSQVALNLDTQGWPVNFVNSRNFFSSTDGYDINYSSTNNKHPNNIGMAEIAAAYLAPTYIPRYSTGYEWESPTVIYNGVTQTVGSTTSVSTGYAGIFNPTISFTFACNQNNNFGYATQSSSIVITLPTTCPAGTKFTVLNAGTGAITFTGATGGNANGIVLYAGMAVELNVYGQPPAVSGSWNTTITNSSTYKSYLTNSYVAATGATPLIGATNGLQTFTLSANATPTVTGILSGQRITLSICQPATGGPYTWTWPAAFHGGMTIGTTASTCSVQSFDSFSGTTFLAESTGITNIAP